MVQAQLDRTQEIVQKTKFEKAKELEETGFDHLVDDRFNESLDSFEEAYEMFPEYHNVDEIRKLL